MIDRDVNLFSPPAPRRCVRCGGRTNLARVERDVDVCDVHAWEVLERLREAVAHVVAGYEGQRRAAYNVQLHSNLVAGNVRCKQEQRAHPMLPALVRDRDVKPENVPAPNPRALVVEDDPTIRALVVEFLTELGFDVTQAWDAAGALAAWKARRRDGPFALVVLDNFFPAHKGAFSRPHAAPFARLFRRDGVPVVVFSGEVSGSDLVDLDRHRVEWVRKPYADQLAGAISRALAAEEQEGSGVVAGVPS